MCVLWSFKKLCFLWFLEHRKKALTKVSHFFSVSIKKKKKKEKHVHWGALRELAAVRTTTAIQMENASRSPCCSYRFWLAEGGWAELGEFGTCTTRVCKVSNLAILMMRNVEWHCDQNQLPRSGTYTCSFFLYSVHSTWFLRGPNTRGNKCLSVKESGKQNNKGGRDLKKFFCCPTPNWEELGASSHSQLFLVHLALIRCRAGTQHPVALLSLGGVKFYKLADFSF